MPTSELFLEFFHQSLDYFIPLLDEHFKVTRTHSFPVLRIRKTLCSCGYYLVNQKMIVLSSERIKSLEDLLDTIVHEFVHHYQFNFNGLRLLRNPAAYSYLDIQYPRRFYYYARPHEIESHLWSFLFCYRYHSSLLRLYRHFSNEIVMSSANEKPELKTLVDTHNLQLHDIDCSLIQDCYYSYLKQFDNSSECAMIKI